jgi:hypothetical protein
MTVDGGESIEKTKVKKPIRNTVIFTDFLRAAAFWILVHFVNDFICPYFSGGIKGDWFIVKGSEEISYWAIWWGALTLITFHRIISEVIAHLSPEKTEKNLSA